MIAEHTKAALYIQKLDEARSLGDWDAVPELIRKTKKYTSQRACLLLTAESEHALALEVQQLKAGTHLSAIADANSDSPNFSGVSKNISSLVNAISNEELHAEDKYQAQVCLGSIHWHMGQSSLAVTRLPNDIGGEYSRLEKAKKEPLQWIKICALKASYIKGSLLQKDNASAEAMKVFLSALPIISNMMPDLGQGKELRLWTELYLTGLCLISSEILKKSFSPDLLNNNLTAFRFWARLWDPNSSTSAGGYVPFTDTARRRIWKEYYFTLSNIFQHRISFSINSPPKTHPEVYMNIKQRTELGRVEAQYESLIMAEVPFPKADEASLEVERFVDTVMRNWRVMLGSSSQYNFDGDGEPESMSRTVLDILYRAAKKTFHSTTILRHLFTVHLAIAEFYLAFKAFDTYMVIVKKSKSRLEKMDKLVKEVVTGGLDNDDTILNTVSESITALCRYRSYQWAEKANKTCEYIEGWLETSYPSKNNIQDHDTVAKSNSIESSIYPQTFALMWRSLGIGYAHWARATFDASSRSAIQLKAIRCFRKSLLPQYQSSESPETMFALGLILAERRQLDAAVKAVKSGLLSMSSNEPPISDTTRGSRDLTKKRLAVPLWHLMALLLSARQEFSSAVKSCEGALDQYDFIRNIPGKVEMNESDKLDQDQSILNRMSNFEKENLLQVKMTELTLIEVLEGPGMAVNASDEVFSLYNKLFGDAQNKKLIIDDKSTQVPPKSSAGKSLRESIFNCSTRKISETASVDQSHSANPPAIHVTGSNSRHKRHRSLTVSGINRNEKTKNTPINRSTKAENISGQHEVSTRGRSRSGGDTTRPYNTQVQESWFINTKRKNNRVSSTTSLNKPISCDSPKVSTSHTAESFIEPDSHIMDNFNFEAVNISLLSQPMTLFSKEEQKRQSMTILVKIWLLISGFYRRASMFDDAQGAIEEARQLVNKIELDISNSSKTLHSPNKGEKGDYEIVANLWSDVNSELGYLSVAEGYPHPAIQHFETALIYSRDHPDSTVGLCNILLDIHTGHLSHPPSLPALALPTPVTPSSLSLNNVTAIPSAKSPNNTEENISSFPIVSQDYHGLAEIKLDNLPSKGHCTDLHGLHHKDPNQTLLDRLAARDRAYGLLCTLTKSGLGWNHSEAWFAFARAYEESGRIEKAKEVLWWCVELEESRSVRDWAVVGSSGYVL